MADGIVAGRTGHDMAPAKDLVQEGQGMRMGNIKRSQAARTRLHRSGLGWWVLAALLGPAACSDEPVEAASAADAAGAGGDALGGDLIEMDVSADATAESDAAGAETDAATQASDTVQWQDTVAATDAAAQTDATSPTDAAGAGTDAVAGTDASAQSEGEQLCPGCGLDGPPGGHPGAPGSYTLDEPQTVQYISGFGNGYAEMLIIKPDFGGVMPVLFFVHGKQLYDGNGFPAEFAQPYRKYLEHVASHGYIVAFVRVEQSLLDADHNRMASDLLKATNVLFDKVTVGNKAKVAFAGHSMGAKIAALAAAKTLTDDAKNEYVDPTAVLAFAISNEPPPIGAFVDAQQDLFKLPANIPTWFTFATGDDDGIATWKDPGKPNAKALYDALKTEKKQLIIVQGTGPNDPNPPTSPELVDDHNACLSVEGSPNLAAGLAPESKSYLNALDWYGYWKWTVGALNFHFKDGDPKWAYGELRAHGGNLPSGSYVKHTIQAQGWSGALPAK